MDVTIRYEAYEDNQPDPDAEPVKQQKTVEATSLFFNGSMVEWRDERGKRHEMRAEGVSVEGEQGPLTEMYAVERHDDGYHGPHRTRHAKSLETALELAEDEREEHRGEEWKMSTRDNADEHLTFHSTDKGSGWVTIKKVPLHE